MYYTLTDLASAATAAVGGVVAATVGFERVIAGVVLMGTVSAGILMPVRRYLWKS